MDTSPVLYADAAVSGNGHVARGPPALVIPARPVFAHDLFDSSPGSNVSWFSTKEDHFYHGKEEPISPILQESDSDETISCSESLRGSSQKNSFGSIARDASFLEFYTEMVDALTPPKTTEAVCHVKKSSALFGALASFQCEVRTTTGTISLQATRQLRLSQAYTIYKQSRGTKEAVAKLRKTRSGAFVLETTEGRELGKIAFCAKEVTGELHRLAEATIVQGSNTPSLPLKAKRPKRVSGPTPQLHLPSKVMPSGHNFQLTHSGKTVLQLGKMCRHNYELRFSSPVDSVLAFGFAVCSLIQSNH